LSSLSQTSHPTPEPVLSHSSQLEAEAPGIEPSETPEVEPHGPFSALRRTFPTGEVIRFLLVGGFNTVFALALYWLLVHVFTLLLPSHSKLLIVDIAQIVSKPVAITVAFLGYKHFVFHTHGNYVKEWLKCVAVYGVSTPVELVILPASAKLFLMIPFTHIYAPYLAGIVNSIAIASYSYFAHKKFSFKQ
jgi:putative flippase GtrA